MREPAADFEPLLERVAALLDQLLCEIAATGVKLDQREIAEPFGRVGLIAVVAGPV